MRKETIPTFIIVELVSRISLFEESIGEYNKHDYKRAGILANTTKGSILVSSVLLKKQMDKLEAITINDILRVIATFKQNCFDTLISN